jgi:hypothetical protein
MNVYYEEIGQDKKFIKRKKSMKVEFKVGSL